MHRLRGTVERYVVVAGLDRVEVDGREPVEVAAGDVVWIPAEVGPGIANIGADDLTCYCVCTPRCKPDCDESLE